MRPSITLIILFIISGSDSTRRFCPPGRKKQFCLCGEQTGKVTMICHIDNVHKLFTLNRGSYVPYLSYLNIFLNDIPTLPSSLLAFSNLKSLVISGNVLQFIQAEAFEGLEKNLELLQVSNTNLRQIPIAAMINLSKLSTLNLEGNKISAINRSLGRLPLRYLYISRNRISTIAKGMLSSKLEVLDLYHNKLTSLNGSLTRHVSNLKLLDISKNFITKLTGELTKIPTLEHLVADSNLIQSIDDGSLSTLYKLESLLLAHNKIYQIVGGLKGLESLVDLDLSYNRLTNIDELAFSDLIMLQILSLKGNNIIYLAESLLNCLSFLKELDISHNNLQDLKFLLSPTSASNLNSAETDTDKVDEQNARTCTVRNYTTLETLRMTGSGVPCTRGVHQVINDLESKGVNIEGNPYWRLGLCNQLDK